MPYLASRDRLKEEIERRLEAVHAEESGAVLLMCLAACMILIMLSLVIYDTGMMTRDKIDAQMAADTAAYSQAGIKARGMNMVATANVGKRTVMGIRNMYYFQYPRYLSWYQGQCSRCCCFPCGCWGACLNCLGNTISLVPFLEGLDYLFFVIGRITGDDLTDHLETLDEYQQDVIEFMPYWAYAEGIIRGIRNGATFVGTYPAPDNTDYGALPLEKDDGLFAPMESCLAPTFVFNPVTLGSMAEWNANFQVLRRNSVSRPPPASQGPRERVRRSLSFAGCGTAMNLGIFADSEPAIPVFFNAEGEDGEAHMRKSNMVFSYRANEQYAEQLRDNYDGVIERDYDGGLTFEPVGGVWSMARSEVLFVSEDEPTVLGRGPNDIFMFHPAWIGKLRPVALPGEDIPEDMSDIWAEADDDMIRQSMIFGGSIGNAIQDQLYMRGVMRGLQGQIDSREVIDGAAK